MLLNSKKESRTRTGGDGVIKVAIVEDDSDYAQHLALLLARYAQERQLTIKTEHFDSGLDFISDYAFQYDIVLMDIEMPHMDGLSAAKKLRDQGDAIPLIFITNMAQYAVNGYEVDALGFLVKPVVYFRLSLLLDKAVARLKLLQNQYLSLNGRDFVKKVYINDIKYIEVVRHTIIYHTTDGDIEMPGTMKELEARLNTFNFVRCNSCWLVNLRHVSGIEGNTVTVAGEELKISRNKKQEFVHRLTAYFASGEGLL